MRYPCNGKRQILIPQPIILGTQSNSGEGTASAEFRVQVPDSRTRVKVSVIFNPDLPVFPIDISGQGATLLMLEEDEGYGGKFSGFLPLTTIVATFPGGTPLALPANPGLSGYSQEFVTAADAIHGFLSWNAGGGLVGRWVLQTRYQPDGQRLPDEDWEETKQLCNANLIAAGAV
jgi:hypothetical protein